MPAFCHFYPGLTPREFRRLTLREFNELADYRSEFLKSQQKG